MSTLSDYKRGLILARTQKYNTDLANLFTYYQGLININNADASLSRGKRINRLNMINRAKTVAVNALRAKYNADINKINKTTVMPPILRTIPKKMAILVGINYVGTPNQLLGCINDTVIVSNILKNSYGYDSANITFMTDYRALKPTRDNIINEFTNLMKNSIEGDSLFFFYSGHGTQKSNKSNSNPLDKIDECIFTIDEKIITDNTFKQIIDTNMKAGVKLTTIFDSCFSGTIMNLRYNYLNSDNSNETMVDTFETSTVGNVICISGCKDAQTSEDAYINGAYDGAMTWALQTTLSSALAGSPLSWAQLITGMRDILKSNTFTQLPQFSSGAELDMNSIVAF